MEWKDINGYNGRYQVNKLGQVRVKLKDKRKRRGEYKILSGSKYTTGYIYFKLGNDKRFTQHRLIAQYFIENPENKKYINHKNGIKDDNRIENLEWCTPKENFHHAERIGLLIESRKKNGHFQRLKRQKQTIDIYTGIVFDSFKIACDSLNLNKNTELNRYRNNYNTRLYYI